MLFRPFENSFFKEQRGDNISSGERETLEENI